MVLPPLKIIQSILGMNVANKRKLEMEGSNFKKLCNIYLKIVGFLGILGRVLVGF